MKRSPFFFFLFVVCLFLCGQNAIAQNTSTGIFDSQGDVGVVKHKGTGVYDTKQQTYTLSGSGTNIWAKADGFHFMWKKMKGDFILRTNVAFIGKGVEMHRKIGFMIRTSLDSTSKHISAAVHGDGLTSLQYRKTAGGETEEKKSTVTGAEVVQLERHGNTYTMSVAKKGD